MIKVLEERREQLKTKIEELMRGRINIVDYMQVFIRRLKLEGRLALYTEITDIRSDDEKFVKDALHDLINTIIEWRDSYMFFPISTDVGIKATIAEYLWVEAATALDLLKNPMLLKTKERLTPEVDPTEKEKEIMKLMRGEFEITEQASGGDKNSSEFILRITGDK